MRYFNLIICFTVVVVLPFINGQAGYETDRLKVSILYESLCPDSQTFFRNQLRPIYSMLKDYIDLQYVPFGKSASLPGSTEFVCQHGPLECFGNRIMSCAFRAAPEDQEKQTQFALCFMSARSPKSAEQMTELSNQCASAAGIPAHRISQCMNSMEGFALQLNEEKITKSLYGSLSFVPTIIYNDQFDQRLQDESLVDFRDVVCKMLRSQGTYDMALRPVCG